MSAIFCASVWAWSLWWGAHALRVPIDPFLIVVGSIALAWSNAWRVFFMIVLLAWWSESTQLLPFGACLGPWLLLGAGLRFLNQHSAMHALLVRLVAVSILMGLAMFATAWILSGAALGSLWLWWKLSWITWLANTTLCVLLSASRNFHGTRQTFSR